MNRRLLDPIPARVIASQRQAADPARSVWVAANAGSGKTHVLTERVLRLLLSGVAPESILCLTYTKAAAAEMRKRVSARLAQWAVADDAVLAADLGRLEGRSPTASEAARARTLFAHALDTPGGLKINTIHAFCEAVLHRFPLEAQVPIDFAVIEDEERAGMVLRARETVLAEGLNGDAQTAEAVGTLFDMLSDKSLTDAIDEALAQGRKLRPLLADRAAAKARLRRLVRMPKGETTASIRAAIAAETLLTPAVRADVQRLTPGIAGGKRFEDRLATINWSNPDPEQLIKTFTTEEGTIRKSLLKADAARADPDLADIIAAEADRLAGLVARLVRASLVARSDALLDVLGAITARYEAEKRARSRLDFDDLIDRIGQLFANPAYADWVKYKLDSGIVHILVDESQDTNPEQWRVVREIADEFFSGAGAVERPRTIFAVGDEKQSIYSFQGADPALFGQTGSDYARRARQVEKPFERVPLHTSFRTLSGILSAVDTAFAADRLRQSVLAPPDLPVQHESARADQGGMVTLWPPIKEAEPDLDLSQWPREPAPLTSSAAAQVADRIATEIRHWIDSARPLGPRGRAITANDVLVLVQTRGPLFREIIRALIRKGLPTPGADRLAVTGHIAVLDLFALADVLLNPADDLQLAALLRSPLFDVSEDDLYALAQPRPRGQSLWSALAEAERDSLRNAYVQLHAWRSRLDFERPFEFFSTVLYAAGGLKRFHARLGPEVDDVFAQFLDLALAHEQTAQPSLQGFLAAMRSRDISIKRELAEVGGGVRVMTVHGAKGLEAPIVIVADAVSQPAPAKLPHVYIEEGPLLVLAGSKEHTPETLAFRQAEQARVEAEYWRKLYVAMTRAEDELYLTGALTRRGTLEGSWYEAVSAALSPAAETVCDAEGTPVAIVYPAQRPSPAPVTAHPVATAPFPAALVLPAVPAEQSVPILRPSSAFVPADRSRVLETSLERLSDPASAREVGTALHALLQHLPGLPRARWAEVAARAAQQLLPHAPEAQAPLAAKALAILEHPALAPYLGPDSRAEVPFLVDAFRKGQPVRLAGRIDRLVVTEKTVLILDYKSDAYVPASADNIDPAYVIQLGLYALVAGQLFPHRQVRAAIFWTALESLMELPDSLLGPAVATFTSR